MESNIGPINHSPIDSKSKLVLSLKKACKELKDQLKEKETEVSDLKRQTKYTNFQEISVENQMFLEEMTKMKKILNDCQTNEHRLYLTTASNKKMEEKMSLLSQLNEELKKELALKGEEVEQLQARVAFLESSAKTSEQKHSFALRDLKKSIREKDSQLKKFTLELEAVKAIKTKPPAPKEKEKEKEAEKAIAKRPLESLIEEKEKIIEGLKVEYNKLQMEKENIEAEKQTAVSSYEMEIFHLRNQLEGFAASKQETSSDFAVLEEIFFDRLVISLYLHNLPNEEFRREANAHGILFVQSLFDKFPGVLDEPVAKWFERMREGKASEQVVSYVCEQIHNFVLPKLEQQKAAEEMLKRTMSLYKNTLEMALSEELSNVLTASSLEQSFSLADIPYSNIDLELIQLRFFQKYGSFLDPTPDKILSLYESKVKGAKKGPLVDEEEEYKHNLEEAIKDYEKETEWENDSGKKDEVLKPKTNNYSISDNYLNPLQREKFRQFYSDNQIIEEHEFERTGESIFEKKKASDSKEKEDSSIEAEYEVYEEDFD